MPGPDNHAIDVAAEITKQALSASDRGWISQPNDVTAFFEAVYKKVKELKSGEKVTR